MDCNKDEAVRARELAEAKMKNNDFEGARKVVQKAQNLCPELENISQLLSICEVHCSAQRLLPGSEKDWYRVLQVERFTDEMTIRKQYRRLALFLHPDKNRFPGAEAAFKLICEANAVLSDPQKKSLYDSKIRIMVRSAQVVPPPHHSNKTSQVNKNYGSEIKVPNGFGSTNQHRTTQSSYSAQVFCTSCPFCYLKYQMDRKFVNTMLRCQKCLRDFTGFEMGAQGVPLESKCAPGSSQNGGVQNGKGYSASNMGSQWYANKQTVRPQPGVRTESIFKDQGVGRAAKVSRNVKARSKESGINTEYGGKEGGTCNGYPNNKEGSRKNKRKGRRSVSTDSSESFDTSSESDLEDVAAGCGVATNPNSGPTRRSSRKRQNISYTEGADDDDDDDDGNRQNDAMDGESAEHENQNGLHNDADFSKSEETGSVLPEERPQDKSDCEKGVKEKGEGGSKPNIEADAVEIEIDSDRDAYSGDNSCKELYQCDDPEFNNFDCDVSCFAVNQYWSCYDSADGMPRFYAKVKKVRLSPFELSVTWLEADPADDTHKKWIDEDLPVGCGTFRVGTTQKISGRDTFAQKMHCEKGKRGSLIIHPRRGEVWAIFRDWDLSWSSQPDSHREYKYEVVEVVSDFDAVAGVRVCYLDKIEGFVSLFQRSSLSAIESFMIRPNEVYRFSHCIRFFKMTGSEREGVPVGSVELDPAALPLNPDHLYYPAKSKMKTDNMEPGVNCAPPTSDVEKGNFEEFDKKEFL